jgi:hypothetical protein
MLPQNLPQPFCAVSPTSMERGCPTRFKQQTECTHMYTIIHTRGDVHVGAPSLLLKLGVTEVVSEPS